jgi:hypothetical protein
MLAMVNAIMMTTKATGIKPSHSNWRILLFIGVLLLLMFVSLFKGEYAGGVNFVSCGAKYFQYPLPDNLPAAGN